MSLADIRTPFEGAGASSELPTVECHKMIWDDWNSLGRQLIWVSNSMFSTELMDEVLLISPIWSGSTQFRWSHERWSLFAFQAKKIDRKKLATVPINWLILKHRWRETSLACWNDVASLECSIWISCSWLLNSTIDSIENIGRIGNVAVTHCVGKGHSSLKRETV